jgi:hypothetical protein
MVEVKEVAVQYPTEAMRLTKDVKDRIEVLFDIMEEFNRVR